MEDVRKIKIKQTTEEYPIPPLNFNLVLMMVASSMLFAGLVSAYIVHQPDALAKNTWTKFYLPNGFYLSLIISTLSSFTMYMAYKSAKTDEIEKNRLFLIVSLVLAIGFCFSQFWGWSQLSASNLTFVNPRPEDISASYVYAITGMHVVHVLGGIVLLAITLLRSFQFRIHKKNMVLMSVSHTYWHFVGFLWFILFLFIYFAQ